MNLILIGFRGTGKSTIGNKVAKQLRLEFVDIDDYIEEKEGASIKEIFAEKGENGFRELEKTAIKEMCLLDKFVIATGGGAVINDENVKNMKKNGFVILLESDPDTIYERLTQDIDRYSQRPKLTEKDARDEIRHLLAVRYRFYHNSADFVLDTSCDSIENICEKIVAVFSLKNH